jgi:diguanylate cyclase (GGDEF)-like protein
LLYCGRHPHLAGKRFDLTQPTVSLGRDAANMIQLPSDLVSRHHGRIERDGSRFVLIDDGSANGTFVGTSGEPIERHRLADGEHIMLGDTLLTFLSGGDLAARHRATLDYIDRHDGLTRLLNRAHWQAEVARLVLYARADDRPLSLLLVDVDQLAGLNRRQGYLAGNGVLLKVAQALATVCGEAAALGRHGADEFGVALPGFDLGHALELAESVRAAIAELSPTIAGESLSVTASVGASTLYQTTGRDELIDDAARAVARAKQSGSNAVCGPDEAAA